MRVTILSHLYPNPLQPARGTFVQQHARALRAAGVEMQVIAPVPAVPPLLAWLKPRWRLLRAVPFEQQAEEGIVRYPRYFTLPAARWRAREGRSVYRAVRPLLPAAPDLIHAHTVIPDGDAARRLAADLGVPFVCTVHGYDALWLRGLGPVRDAILATFQAAAHVVCVSDRLRRDCLAHDPRPAHFSVIHHGAPEVTGPRPPRAAGQTVLSVGNLIRQKGFRELLSAWATVAPEFPHARLTIVGDGPERAVLEAEARRLAVSDRVTFTGTVPPDRLAGFYDQADVFCLASENEGFGLVYLEAMMHGLPVIGSEGEGIADIITCEENGLLVPARQPRAIAAALSRLLSGDDLRLRLAEAGRRTASELTWARHAQAHLALYRRLLPWSDAAASPTG